MIHVGGFVLLLGGRRYFDCPSSPFYAMVAELSHAAEHAPREFVLDP
jgi:hypothetical protein